MEQNQRKEKMKSKKGMQSKGSETKRIKNGNYLGRRKRNHNTGKGKATE